MKFKKFIYLLGLCLTLLFTGCGVNGVQTVPTSQRQDQSRIEASSAASTSNQTTRTQTSFPTQTSGSAVQDVKKTPISLIVTSRSEPRKSVLPNVKPEFIYIGKNAIAETLHIEIWRISEKGSPGFFKDSPMRITVTTLKKVVRIFEGGDFSAGRGRDATMSLNFDLNHPDLTIRAISNATFEIGINSRCLKACTKLVPKNLIEENKK